MNAPIGIFDSGVGGLTVAREVFKLLPDEDIVYFGESVAKPVVEQAYSLVEDAEALLVAGSSLTVFSGYRFVRHAAAHQIPVAIVNRGPTRGDDLATVKIDSGCSEMLTLLADELLPVPAIR